MIKHILPFTLSKMYKKILLQIKNGEFMTLFPDIFLLVAQKMQSEMSFKSLSILEESNSKQHILLSERKTSLKFIHSLNGPTQHQQVKSLNILTPQFKLYLKRQSLHHISVNPILLKQCKKIISEQTVPFMNILKPFREENMP